MSENQSFETCTLFLQNEFLGHVEAIPCRRVTVESLDAEYVSHKILFVPKGARRDRVHYVIRSCAFAEVLPGHDWEGGEPWGEEIPCDTGASIQKAKYTRNSSQGVRDWIDYATSEMARRDIRPLFAVVDPSYLD